MKGTDNMQILRTRLYYGGLEELDKSAINDRYGKKNVKNELTTRSV